MCSNEGGRQRQVIQNLNLPFSSDTTRLRFRTARTSGERLCLAVPIVESVGSGRINSGCNAFWLEFGVKQLTWRDYCDVIVTITRHPLMWNARGYLARSSWPPLKTVLNIWCKSLLTITSFFENVQIRSNNIHWLKSLKYMTKQNTSGKATHQSVLFNHLQKIRWRMMHTLQSVTLYVLWSHIIYMSTFLISLSNHL